MGHCTDTTASCFAIKLYDPTATTDGPYTHKVDGTEFYCDMTNGGRTYYEIGFANFDYATTNGAYERISSADLADPVRKQAFIYLMNKQGGANRLASFSSTNCCMYGDSSTSFLAFGTGNYLQPTNVSNNTLACNGTYSNAKYGFSLATTPQALPLATNYFAGHAPQQVTGTPCAQSTTGKNPALFWRRSPP
jgi:hypothetical protein